jgi:magnesium chelatase subunit I
VSRPGNLGELRESGWQSRGIRDEMRENLCARLRRREPLFPTMIGYRETVVPQIETAVLAGHDMIFLGERGQGKSRMIRMLVELLDEWLPIVEGSEVTDDPFRPISKLGRTKVTELGDRTPIVWISREERYGEKLATPDVTIADLLGDVDPIRVAEGRYLADETTIHFGLVPRTNRGIFCINEIPDLPERVQVGLFNVMEEQDFQVKGFKVRLPLDVLVVASANPEDYTRRGRIITPLKDRYQAQIRTHYPPTRPLEIQVMHQERRRAREAPVEVHVPPFFDQILGELTLQARQSPDVSRTSGVSVRVSIANYETLVAACERRALALGEREAVPRISDLPALAASTLGKLELEYAGQETPELEVFHKLVRRAIKVVFDEHLALDDLRALLGSFEGGWKVEAGPMLPSSEYVEGMDNIEGLRFAVEKLGATGSPARAASAIEFVLEGLHLSNKLNKSVQDGRVLYK